jgi:hypothetical protein
VHPVDAGMVGQVLADLGATVDEPDPAGVDELVEHPLQEGSEVGVDRWLSFTTGTQPRWYSMPKVSAGGPALKFPGASTSATPGASNPAPRYALAAPARTWPLVTPRGIHTDARQP